MKIAIDALGIHYFGGGRTATLRLLEALFSLDTHNEYVVALSQPEPTLVTASGNVSQWLAPVKNRLMVRLWAQLAFPVRFRNFDIVHFMKNLGVFGLKARSVVTIYDLTTLIYPDLFPAIDVLYWRTIQKMTLRQATKVIAISENTSRDIQSFYGLLPDKIRVIYPAHADHFMIPKPKDVIRVRRKYNLPNRFIVHVGRIDRKKNLGLLIRAFYILRQSKNFDGKLVFVGEEYHKSRDDSIQSLLTKLELLDQVQFVGAVPDDDLVAIYGAAHIAVFCSLHEGFGIVALEAMACGVPLVVTPAGGILEAVGNAAKVVPLDEPEILAQAIREIWYSPVIWNEMRAKGLEQASRFHWGKTALQTLALYEEIMA